VKEAIMALNQATITRIELVLQPLDADGAAIEQIRREFPGLRLTSCDLSDVGMAEPYRQFSRFNLYLVDTSEHCWRLTTDLANASGLVVAGKRPPQTVRT
jgi:hypothetical protein